MHLPKLNLLGKITARKAYYRIDLQTGIQQLLIIDPVFLFFEKQKCFEHS